MELKQIADWDRRAARANWSVQKLAKQCGVSPRTLQRFFKGKFGVLPKDWLVRLRMQKATEALLSDGVVKSAASSADYNNPFHFSREFRKHFGYPPSQHRAEKRQRG